MPRSLKKGPFVDDHLMKKVDQQNEKARAASSRRGRAALMIVPAMLRTHDLPCTTAWHMFVSGNMIPVLKLRGVRANADLQGHIKDDRKAKAPLGPLFRVRT